MSHSSRLLISFHCGWKSANLVMAWNTHQMQAALDRWRAQGRRIDPQILHHITPMGFEGINFGGILVFPWSDTGHDCCRRVRRRPRRWSRKKPTDYPIQLPRLRARPKHTPQSLPSRPPAPDIEAPKFGIEEQLPDGTNVRFAASILFTATSASGTELTITWSHCHRIPVAPHVARAR
jgi:hypothetical protein